MGESTFLQWCVLINTVFCPCYLFLLWNVVLKCLALCLITIIAACFPHLLYACLPCSSVHASSLHPLLAHHHLCYVDVYCFFYFCYRLCYIYLWLHFGLLVDIFSLSFLFLCHSMRLLQFCIVTFPIVFPCNLCVWSDPSSSNFWWCWHDETCLRICGKICSK